MIVLDCEVYIDYFLVSFLQPATGKVVNFEMYEGCELNRRGVASVMANNLTVGFNSSGYDLLILVAALQEFSNEALKNLSDAIITSGKPHWQIARDNELRVPIKWDHIDIMPVAPGMSGLKIYGGRLHTKTMQDLPYDPAMSIGPTEREALVKYCINDLQMTAELFEKLRGNVELRVSMSEQYGMDLRSKSDAQIAETIIKSELEQSTGMTYRVNRNPNIKSVRYKDPRIIEFKTEQLKDVFAKILKQDFEIGKNGSVVMPDWLKKTRIEIEGAFYQMGIGGLHSNEKRQYVKRQQGWILEDRDVAAYYPNIILQQNISPEILGRPFLNVYKSLVDRRIGSKRHIARISREIGVKGGGSSELRKELAYQKTQDAVLKISINGAFGKLGSKYSVLYSPDLLIQTTITGQLGLLMLIEKLSLAGIKVLSANTDGLVLHYPEEQADTVETICFDWMLLTSFNLETTGYNAIASRDVNNYVAVGTDGSVKGKGLFTNTGLNKNPDFSIVARAAALQVSEGLDFRETIRGCDDVTQFVTVRQVNGGAIWRDSPLGRAVRFYISSEIASDECIHYVTNGNRVPKSAGARPLMILPDNLPSDINYKYYETETEKLLSEIGYL